MPVMNAQLNHDIREAVALGQAVAIESDAVPLRAASPEVEARLSKLFAVSVGMFTFSMTTILAVGVMLF